jgi:glucose/arabinose dehydrogenase
MMAPGKRDFRTSGGIPKQPDLRTLLLFSCVTLAPAASITDHYTIEKLPLPKGLDPQVGALAVAPSGKLFAAFHRGEVLTWDPKHQHWHPFAFGLHEPLGMVVVNEREVLVMQRPELTRLVDQDGDGTADLYETVCDDFGISGNYHEFNFGPAQDAKGDLYIGLNVASNGDKTEKELRGEFRHFAVTHDQVVNNWKESKGKIGRMYSVVPYRGWVVKIDAKTGKMTPYASGLRSPNSLGFDAEGRLLVCDNQGDWLGSSKLHHVVEGAFHGHPASLVWCDDWKLGHPLKVPVADLDKLRVREAMFFPQGILANSPTQPLLDTTGGKFGPYANQVFVGEMNISRIMRVLPETVAGQTQAAGMPFWDKNGLTQGINRLAFAPDGSLYVGQTRLSWAGGEGIQKITWKGTVPMDVHGFSLTDDGFAMRFTKPADPATMKPEAFKIRRYYYEYHEAYGADTDDLSEPKVTKITPGKDGTEWSLTLDSLKPGYVYEFTFKGIKGADGEDLINTLLCYTCNRLRDGSAPGPQIPGTAPPKPPKEPKKK